MPGEKRALVGPIRLFASHPPVSANDALQLRRRRIVREMEEVFLASRIGDAAERSHLRIRELPAAERLGDPRQLAEATRYPNVLARRPRRDRAAPRDPLCAGATAGAGPAVAPVELRHQLQPAATPGADVLGERLDLVLAAPERERRA